MDPATLNLTIHRGRDFIKDFIFLKEDGTPEDISLWEFKSEIREEKCIESPLLATFKIYRDVANGRIRLALTDQETFAIPEGTAYWDLLVTILTIDESYICGKVKVKCCPTEV
jgi:hypothetical protein